VYVEYVYRRIGITNGTYPRRSAPSRRTRPWARVCRRRSRWRTCCSCRRRRRTTCRTESARPVVSRAPDSIVPSTRSRSGLRPGRCVRICIHAKRRTWRETTRTNSRLDYHPRETNVYCIRSYHDWSESEDEFKLLLFGKVRRNDDVTATVLKWYTRMHVVWYLIEIQTETVVEEILFSNIRTQNNGNQ